MFTSRGPLVVATIVCAGMTGPASSSLAAASVPATTSAASSTSTSTSTAEVIGLAMRTGRTTAAIPVRYTCTGTPEQVHARISLTQTADRTADPRLTDAGTEQGGVVAAWSQSRAGSPICDGRTHIGVFTVDQDEAGYGDLQRGWAYIQFDLMDAENQTEPVGDAEFGRLVRSLSDATPALRVARSIQGAPIS